MAENKIGTHFQDDVLKKNLLKKTHNTKLNIFLSAFVLHLYAVFFSSV